jgi:MFS family permease
MLQRLIWGFLSSRIGFKVIFTIVCILSILSYQIIIHINNQITYLLAYTIINIGLGGLMVIVPNVSLLIFGKKVG